MAVTGRQEHYQGQVRSWHTDFSGERCPCVFNLLVSGSSGSWENKHRRTDNELVMVAIHPVLGVECIGCPPVESP